MKLCTVALGFVFAVWAPQAFGREESKTTLRVPAFTAYSEPDAEALDISPEHGVTGWTSEKESVVWYGKLNTSGRLNVAVSLRLPKGEACMLRLMVGNQVMYAQAKDNTNGGPISIVFGPATIPNVGYYRFALFGMTKSGLTFGAVDALLLDGPAAQNAHFHLTAPQRGAPSVHLSYPIPKDAQVQWFYNEVTAKTDPLWSYYMACGWHRGYFGMQVNSPTERRLIFSVWDSGNEAKDRARVGEDDKVKLLAKGDGVFADSFGNEGTGGHSHLVYNWKTGQTYRFLVAAQPDGAATIYSGYFFFPEKGKWGLIARFRAPKDGSYLRGLYSFDEDFSSANGQKKRLAEFGPQWIKSVDGTWTELTRATFTHTGKDSRADYDAGAIGSRFFLAGGGFADGSVKFRDTVQRPAQGKPPADIVLPQ